MSILDRYIKYVFMFLCLIVLTIATYLKYSNTKLTEQNRVLIKEKQILQTNLDALKTANRECNNTLTKLEAYAIKQDKVLENYLREVRDAKNTKIDTLSDFINYAN